MLDLACGRGGDIWKWADAQVCSSVKLNVLHGVHRHQSMQTVSMMDMQIKYIKGIDLSPNEVQEARRRFQEMKVKRRNMNRGEQTRFCGSLASITTNLEGLYYLCLHA